MDFRTSSTLLAFTTLPLLATTGAPVGRVSEQRARTQPQASHLMTGRGAQGPASRLGALRNKGTGDLLRRTSLTPRATKKVRGAETLRPKASESAENVPPDVAEVGGTAPMGKYWDPLSFTDVVRGPNQLKRFREAELTHGRVAMLGALGFLVQESFHPLFGGDIDGPAINHFQQITSKAPSFWIPVLASIAVAELGRARIGWKEPFDGTNMGNSGNLFSMKEGYLPGDIGFDPLNLFPQDDSSRRNIQNKELNNGRLAMLALAGFMAQELVNGKPILENLNEALNGVGTANAATPNGFAAFGGSENLVNQPMTDTFIPFGGAENSMDLEPSAKDIAKDILAFKEATG